MSDVEIVPPTPADSFLYNANGTAVLLGMALCPAGSLNENKPAKADALATSQVVGLATRNTNEAGQAQYPKAANVLVLTTEEWDAVAGTTGGLVEGDAYYLSAATAGHITSVAPSASGSFIVRVGIALSPTRLLVTLNAPVGPHG